MLDDIPDSSIEIGSFIEPFKVLTDKNTGELYLPILYRFFNGKGISRNQNSALVRPFRKVIEEGKPVDNVVHVLFEDKNEFYVLGSFSYTNKRILFFPGIAKMGIMNPTLDYLSQKRLDFFVDHLTLDENFTTWHYTDLDKRKKNNKLPTEGTRKITESLFLWFLWGVQPNQLERLPLSQIIYVKGNDDKEILRRTENIVDARTGGAITITKADDVPKDSHYWHFEFFINKESVESDPEIANFGISPLYFPGLPIIVKEDRTIALARIFPIHIQGFRGTVFIMASKIKGSFPMQSGIAPGHLVP